MKIVNLSGGGLDSAALLYMSVLPPHEVPPPDAILHIYYGQVSGREELEATKLLRRVTRVFAGKVQDRTPELLPMYYEPRLLMSSIPDSPILQINPNSELFGGKGDPFLRGRNLDLIIRAAHIAIKTYGTAEPITIQLGLCVEEMMFDDANGDYIELVNQVMRASYGTVDGGSERLISVTAPLAAGGWKKLLLFSHLYSKMSFYSTQEQAEHALFDAPFSCWTPVNGKLCGNCLHCTKLDRLRIAVVGINLKTNTEVNNDNQ